jgi:outer membrane protein assembly factor BamD
MIKCFRTVAVGAGLALTLMLSGCATLGETYTGIKGSITGIFGGSDENQTAEELAWAGMEYYDDGSYKKAVDSFQRLKDIYPFSQYAILAELKIGDAHYRLEQYEDAIFAYEEFEKLHPRNEAIPYVIYQIGRSHFDRMTTADRDQSSTRKALETFQRLIQQHPDSPYARSAAEHVVSCYKSLSGHDFGIGVFYFNSKHYPAALARFRSVVIDYPDVGYHQQALDYIARTEAKIAETGFSDTSSRSRSGT